MAHHWTHTPSNTTTLRHNESVHIIKYQRNTSFSLLRARACLSRKPWLHCQRATETATTKLLAPSLYLTCFTLPSSKQQDVHVNGALRASKSPSLMPLLYSHIIVSRAVRAILADECQEACIMLTVQGGFLNCHCRRSLPLRCCGPPSL